MKNLYLTIAAALIVMAGAQAQTISYSMAGKPIANGATVHFNEMQIVDDYGEEGYQYVYDPHLTFTCSETGTIDAEVVCTSGQAVQFCLNGSCEKKPEIKKTNVPVTAGEAQNSQFEFGGDTYSATELPPSDVTVVISMQYTGKPETKSTVTFIINSSTQGSVIGLGDEVYGVAYADGTLRYNAEKKAELVICDTTGAKVLCKEVQGKGSISLSGLAKGIYVYTIESKSGKFLVR
ncbi:MAG: T9SS type A sorting domain-containing protein [Muribaculaceae bacterium]|nr:T9SS type A sorting domain-containing protein [Muribaculaceae bacterium]